LTCFEARGHCGFAVTGHVQCGAQHACMVTGMDISSNCSDSGLLNLESEVEIDRKRILRFRPKTKTKLSSLSNNMRQCNVLLCEYLNDAS